MRESPPIIRRSAAVNSAAEPRLLLDTYACLGPGADALIPLVSALAQSCAAAGVALCVDAAAWSEAAQDPDLRRRAVDLSSLGPLLQLPALPVPSNRDLSSRFVPVRNEADGADLRLLGALHSRAADLLVTQETRLRRLADRAGIGARILTLAEAMDWIDALQGRATGLSVTEIQPIQILDHAVLNELLAHECEVFDPYLRSMLAENRGRALVARNNGRVIGFAVLTPGADGPQLELRAFALEPASLSALPFEAMIIASRALARRRDVELHALVPPHGDFAALLLEQIGFERRGLDRHGRTRFVDVPADGLENANAYWMLHLEPDAHAALLPEVGGLAQQQLFLGDARPAAPLAAGVRRRVAIPRQAREPASGDVVFTMHGRADSLAASRALTAALVVLHAARCDNAAELMIASCHHGRLSAREIPALLAGGGATVLTLLMLGRLEHPVPFARLKQLGLVRSLPHALRRLERTAVAQLAPSLALV